MGGRRTTYADDTQLPEVTDEMLQASLATTRPYTVVILKAGPRYSPPVVRIYPADPAVQAGALTYEIHPTRSFPRSALPD